MKNAALTHLRCATVANADVTSGIVGYQTLTIPAGYSIFTVTFKDVNSETYDLQNIVPQVADKNKVYAQKCAADGSYTTVYNYRPDKSEWYQGIKAISTPVTLSNGEALCFNNKYDADITVQVSGEVVIEPWSGAVPSGYMLVGNMTPVEIDLQDIVPYDTAATPAIIADKNKVYIQKCGTDGSYLTVYNYRPDKAAWYQGIKAVGRDEVKFAPGEAACLNNKYETAIQLKFPSPIE